jgi:AcrR family transcriptional regulator
MDVPEAATRDRLLHAAVEEFAEHGLAGARVERIAGRAQANKQLVYYYFGSKLGLFDAAVTAMAERWCSRSTAAGSLSDWLVEEADAVADEPQWTHLLAFESRQRGNAPVMSEADRRQAARAAVARVRDAQRSGRLPRGFDPAQLYLAVHALASHPASFPQLVRHVTGRAADDPAQRRAQRKFLRQLADRLSGSES